MNEKQGHSVLEVVVGGVVALVLLIGLALVAGGLGAVVVWSFERVSGA